MEVLGCVEQPVDPIREPPQCRQRRQVLQDPRQVGTLGLGELLPTLHHEVTIWNTQWAFSVSVGPRREAAALAFSVLRPRFFFRPALPRRAIAAFNLRTASRISPLIVLRTCTIRTQS